MFILGYTRKKKKTHTPQNNNKQANKQPTTNKTKQLQQQNKNLKTYPSEIKVSMCQELWFNAVYGFLNISNSILPEFQLDYNKRMFR